ncbi:purine and uridine phosphorylase [Aspergillus granulosus]|uniref:Purine and uridine phosphorylase n=1 Tax=Aspergillus granulosus TaxID=176169 RepID=A0ABR4GX19_9EURO
MRPKNRNDFAIAIICALPLEADAVEALFDEHYDRLGKYYGKQWGDANAYINGRIGKHDVVLCYMPGMGKGSAASVASSLQVSYPGIKLALVVGICGGAPPPPKYQEIFLGDVIISDSVIEYDFGRHYPGGFKRKTGVKDTLGRPGREIRTLLNGLRAENARKELQDQAQQYLQILQQRGAKWCHPGVNDILFKASYLHKHHSHSSTARCSCFGSDLPEQICEAAFGKDCDGLYCDSDQQIRCREVSEAIQTSIYIGSVASADTIMKSGQHRDEIVRREKVIGFEMEGAGVWVNVPCIIIKGVCDYADSHKSKLWQAYAAATGASVTKAFLEYWMPVSREASHLVFRNIPFPRNEGFVGRGEQLDELEELLFSPGCQRKAAITGLGGVGKTQVALEFAYRTQQTRPECSIYWIPATNLEILQRTYLQIAERLALRGVEEERADAGKLLKDYLCDNKAGQWLLIFDNADDMSMWFDKTEPNTEPCGLSNYVPWSTTGSVLFTSRFKRVASKLAKQNLIEIPEMDETRATELLFERLSDKSLLDQTKEVVLLLKELVYLPLAIVQAASYINENCLGSLSDYLSLLSGQEDEVIDLLSEDFEDEWRADRNTNPVAATWRISFEQIQRTQPIAADILCFMATIEPADIPQSILPPAPTYKAWIEAIGTLKGYAFVSRRAAEQSFDLHRLIHLATRNWLRQKAILSKWTITALTRLEAIFPNDDHTNRHVWKGYLPHALRLLEREETKGAEVKVESTRYDLIFKVSRCLLADGRAIEAVKCLEEHYDWHKGRFDDSHPSRLASQHALAVVYRANGQISQAWSYSSMWSQCAREPLPKSTLIDRLLSRHSHNSSYRHLRNQLNPTFSSAC